VTALPPDYDDDPERWLSLDRSWQAYGDVHQPVAARIVLEQLSPVVDVGGGDGRLGTFLPDAWPSVVVDASPTQLVSAAHPKVQGDAFELPIVSETFGAVCMLWMLYHLEMPVQAIREAKRVLRPGGLFVACTAARDSCPELTDGYPPSTFDAEEAGALVGEVFDQVEIERWDAPMTHLLDQDAVKGFCRTHLLPLEAADRVQAPVWITMRGCLVWARNP
jgi:SAM-dependent methyltransferase